MASLPWPVWRKGGGGVEGERERESRKWSKEEGEGERQEEGGTKEVHV